MAEKSRILVMAILLLVIILLACEEGSGPGSCNALWADCPGVVNDYLICGRASDLEQEVSGGVRYFSYYNCSLGSRTPTLSISAECSVSFRY